MYQEGIIQPLPYIHRQKPLNFHHHSVHFDNVEKAERHHRQPQTKHEMPSTPVQKSSRRILL